MDNLGEYIYSGVSLFSYSWVCQWSLYMEIGAVKPPQWLRQTT